MVRADMVRGLAKRYFSLGLLGLMILGSLAFQRECEAFTHSKLFAKGMTFNWLTGDLLFVYDPRSSYQRAIALTTEEQFHQGPRLSHVVALDRDETGALFVIDASDHGIRRLPFQTFLQRYSTETMFMVAQVKSQWIGLAQAAVAQMKEEALGLPYDRRFSSSSEAQHCSKLIQTFYRDHDQSPLFDTYPMYFGREGTSLRRFWEQHFLGLRMTPPIGHPGMSPQSIYLDGLRKDIFSVSRWMR